MAGYNYWFPKVFGFRLDERWGKASFWCWFVGFYLAFMPLYALGLMGMTRRLQHYDNPAWQPWLMVAAFGAVVILAGVACQAIQLVVSVRDRRQLRDTTGDPWARPHPGMVHAVAAAGLELCRPAIGRPALVEHAQARGTQDYKAIEMPSNSPIGFITAFFAVVTGFALIWHIWWMAGLGLLGAFVTLLAFAFRRQEEIEVPAVEIARFDRAHPAEVTP